MYYCAIIILFVSYRKILLKSHYLNSLCCYSSNSYNSCLHKSTLHIAGMFVAILLECLWPIDKHVQVCSSCTLHVHVYVNYNYIQHQHHPHSLWCEEWTYFTYWTYSQLLNQPSKKKYSRIYRTYVHVLVQSYSFLKIRNSQSYCKVIIIIFYQQQLHTNGLHF